MLLELNVIGHVGQDAVLKEVNGKKVINFSVAHTEKWTGGDGVPKERTTWVECALWDNEKMAQYLKSGQQVYLSGTPSASAYANKDGELITTIKLTVFKVVLLGKAPVKDKAYSDAIKDKANEQQQA